MSTQYGYPPQYPYPQYDQYPPQRPAPKQKTYSKPHQSKKKKYTTEIVIIVAIALFVLFGVIIDNIKVTFKPDNKCYVTVFWVTVHKQYSVTDLNGIEDYSAVVSAVKNKNKK